MPINIPDGLPAKTILQQERIFALEEEVASHQHIRPLRLAILNLMPTKIETETQILRLISKSPLQVSCDFMRVSSHESKNTSADHLVKFYDTFDAFATENYDGLIVTGAPVEHLPCRVTSEEGAGAALAGGVGGPSSSGPQLGGPSSSGW